MDEKRKAPVTGTTVEEEKVSRKRRTTGSPGEPEPGPYEGDPKRIRDRMHRTERRMHDTLEEMRHRLDYGRLKGRAKETMSKMGRDKASQYKQKVGASMNRYSSTGKETIKRNSLPAALIGLGAGWFVFSYMKERKEKSRGRHYPHECRYFYNAYTGEVQEECPPEEQGRAEEYKEKASGKLSQAKEKLSTAAEEYKDRMRHTAEQYTERFRHRGRGSAREMGEKARYSAENIGEEAKHRAERMGEGFSRGIRDYPMAMGVAALAVGSLLGMLIPESRVEDEYLGPRRDEMLDQAKEMGREKVEQAKHAVEESRETLREEMSSGSEKETV